MSVRRYRKKWMIDIDFVRPDGSTQRVRKVSPVQTKRGAMREERDVRTALENGTYGKKEVEEKKKITLGEFAEKFTEDYVVPNNKTSERIMKRSILTRHILPEFGERLLEGIATQDIEHFKAKQLAAGLSRKTVNNHLALLSKLFNTAVEWEVIERGPRIRLLKVAKSAFDFLTFDELEQLLAAADDRDRTILTLLAKTGLRLSEVRALRWKDIDLGRRIMTVHQGIVHGVLDSPKGGRSRSIELSDVAVATLRAHPHLRGKYVFCGEGGSMLALKELYQRLHAVCERAGLRKIGFHTLRHTFASHLVMRGAPLKVAQELLGHADVRTTMIYAHLSPEARHEYVNLLDSQRHNSGTSSVGSEAARGDKSLFEQGK